ncbi:MAG: ribosome silencing factor, partial [Acidimicrobiaceae bacterium]
LFVVASAGNKRQVRTICDAITDAVRTQTGRSPLSSEGMSQQQWILIDYGSVVVHVFDDDTRRFYEIERLYRDVPLVSWRLVS